jgi:hypothetical protein
LVVIVGGLFGLMALSDAGNSWEPPERERGTVYDADSVMIFLYSAQSDTVWSIYIPARGIPMLDTLGVMWWTGGIKKAALYSGWGSLESRIERIRTE